MKKFIFLGTLLLLFTQISYAQNTSIKDTFEIRKLLSKNAFSKAEEALELAVEFHKKHNNYENLVGYIPLIADTNFTKNEYYKKIAYIDQIVSSIKSSKNLDVTENAYSEFSKVYNKYGNRINIQALSLFNSGQTEASIKKIKEAIAMFQNAIEIAPSEKEKRSMKQRKYALVDNLGGFYRAIENIERLIQITTYSYEEKKKFLPKGDPNLILSNAILSHAHLLNQDLNLAVTYSDVAFNNMDKIAYAKDYILLVRASIYENLGDMQEAENTYKQMEVSYREKSEPYTLGFLDAIVEASRFYVKINDFDKAISLAEEGYEVTHRPTFKNNLARYYQTSNLAQIYFENKQYANALRYSNEALDFFSSDFHNKGSILDSVQNMRFKPKTLAIKLNTEYELKENIDTSFLKKMLSETDDAINVISLVKQTLTSSADLNTLLSNSSSIIAFRKKVLNQLYLKTQEKYYLQQLISLHESNIYTRIRGRLNFKNASFSGVPETILKREKQLKENINNVLSSSSEIEDFFKADAQRIAFLDSIKKKYPKYYKLKYSTIEESLNDLMKKTPANTTLMRYFFIDKELKVYIATSETQRLVSLEFDKEDNAIKVMSNYKNELDTIIKASNELYAKLWAPVADFIKTENVIIYPDQELFNLSYELLTPKKITSFRELGTQGLLSKHNISYNYSLLLVDKERKTLDFENDFVAYAPEFNSTMKHNYSMAITDSLDLDKSYLTLIPQPFSSDLIENYTEKFNGTSFLNENASKKLFLKNAKEHKIIHIGTHAESNNINPELSRLVFAKNIADSTNINDNYLYTYEIYNQNLSSNLAILTACETGKPTYEPGEGMISLAHAFNYAGSESILTSLWRIDEQSSTQILDYFYGYLEDGLPKDEALRNAKLDYLSKAEGRTLHPQYWAGLVLMGDTSPIALNKGFLQKSSALWIIFTLLVLVITVFLVLVRKRLLHANP